MAAGSRFVRGLGLGLDIAEFVGVLQVLEFLEVVGSGVVADQTGIGGDGLTLLDDDL